MVNQFKGVIKKIYKRSNYTGNSIFGIETDEIDVIRNRGGLVECEGVIPAWPLGILVEVNGDWDESKSKIMIRTITPSTPTEDSSRDILKTIIKKLKEQDEKFKVGNTLVKKILEITGSDILNYIKKDNSFDELLRELKIDEWKVERIHQELIAINDSQSLVEFVTKFGGNFYDCDALIKKYGRKALTRLKSNPYQVGRSIGMDFYVVDEIGKSRKTEPLGKERFKAIIYQAVDNLLTKHGATYCIQSMLTRQVDFIVKKSSYPEIKIPAPWIAVRLESMRGLKVELAKNGARIYRTDVYNQEINIAKNLKRLSKTKESQASQEAMDSMVEKIEKEFSINYAKEQKDSFQSLLTTGVKIITGGPGVGKTTNTNGLIHAYMELFPGKKIALAAPTGRAAQRMWDITNVESKTIHKLVEYIPYEKSENLVLRNEDNPIDADLIIIDEMSMVDTYQFSILLPAIKTGSTVLLIGDENQLQSVSPGNILHDLIKSECFEVYRLTRVYRQKGDNTIIENAYRILDGSTDLEKNSRFMVFPCKNEKEATETIISSFKEWYEVGDLNSIQILSPIKGGECGTNQISKNIAKYIQDEKAETTEAFHYGKTVYQVGDKVIFHKNNYILNYFNGDIGYVTDIIKEGVGVLVGKEIKKVTGKALNDITLAYAITMHKSQGSEFEDVIIVLPDTYKNMLTRNLLFTAVTRAKTRVKIIYINSALSDAIHTVTINKRFTGLVDKIRKAM